MGEIFKKIPAFFLFILFVSFNAVAQPPPTPPGEEPGSLSERYKSETERERKTVEKKKVKAPEVKIEEKEKKPEVPAGSSFTLKAIDITGSTLYKAEDFRPIYKPYLDKKITFQELAAIADEIEKKYKKGGYLTTTVYIPEQDIKEGRVEIRVSEGRMGDITVEGSHWFPADLVKKYIHIKKNEVLSIFRLQRDLLRLNQTTDLEVKTVVSPGKEPGTTDLALTVVEKLPYHIGTSFDTQGSRLVGKGRNSFSFRSTNLSGRNDSLYVSTLMTGMSSGTFASYLIPVDTYGTKLGLDIAYFTMKLGQEYKGFDITGVSESCTLHISGEIYLSEDFHAFIDAGLEIKSSKKNIIGEKSTDDQLRVPYVGFDLTKMDTLFGGGQTSFSPRVSIGTAHFLGASGRNHGSASRPNTGGYFFKYGQDLNRVQRMPFESYISARTKLQLASNTLSSSEQFSLGGANSIRGYPEGDYSADIGASLNVDWIFPMYLFPKDWKLPNADRPLRNQIQPVVFADVGGGRIKDHTRNEREHKFLVGVGAGLKIQYNSNLFLRLEWAERVGDRPAQAQGPSNFYIAFQFEV